MTLKEIKEKLVFEHFKNRVYHNVDDLREFAKCNLDFTRLHAQITKYQIKKYGTTLHTYTDKMTKERALYISSLRAKKRSDKIEK